MKSRTRFTTRRARCIRWPLHHEIGAAVEHDGAAEILGPGDAQALPEAALVPLVSLK